MKCAKCNVEVTVELTPAAVGAGKFRRKQECPVCHERVFSFIHIAEKSPQTHCIKCKEAAGTFNEVGECPRCTAESAAFTVPQNKDGLKMIGKSLKCERCEATTDKLYVIELVDHLLCYACKMELLENHELMCKYHSGLCY